jgi:hypothetical protein
MELRLKKMDKEKEMTKTLSEQGTTTADCCTHHQDEGNTESWEMEMEKCTWAFADVVTTNSKKTVAAVYVGKQ